MRTLRLERDGDSYAGQFKDGAYEGQGVYISFVNGYEKYVGEWKGNAPHGEGEFTFPNGDLYKGFFKEGFRDGEGIYENAEGKKLYDGQWSKGHRTGYGLLMRRDGSVWYEGDFYRGEKHGTGTLTRTDGSSYQGEFFGDVRHGLGVEFPPPRRAFSRDPSEEDARRGGGNERDEAAPELREDAGDNPNALQEPDLINPAVVDNALQEPDIINPAVVDNALQEPDIINPAVVDNALQEPDNPPQILQTPVRATSVEFPRTTWSPLPPRGEGAPAAHEEEHNKNTGRPLSREPPLAPPLEPRVETPRVETPRVRELEQNVARVRDDTVGREE